MLGGCAGRGARGARRLRAGRGAVARGAAVAWGGCVLGAGRGARGGCAGRGAS